VPNTRNIEALVAEATGAEIDFDGGEAGGRVLLGTRLVPGIA